MGSIYDLSSSQIKSRQSGNISFAQPFNNWNYAMAMKTIRIQKSNENSDLCVKFIVFFEEMVPEKEFLE